jgi:hypothetical protein
MSLTTFGAIMGFAAAIVGKSADLYALAIEKAQEPVLKETLQLLLAEEKKNHALMEQARRENVTEMILEPVSGLRREDYEIDRSLSVDARDGDFLKMAFMLEEKEEKFFHEASGKISLPEVARIFRKIAQKKEKNLMKLKSLGLEQALKGVSKI